MKKWFSYTFIGLLALAAGLFAYHFYAAADAERKLDESIRNISAQTDAGLTVNYSSIQVDPFSGDVIFSDVNIIRNEDIQRAKTARFDLGYSDFVNITIWGTEYGLRNIEEGLLALSDLSYTGRSNLVEIKMDSLNVNYRGNLWNLIVLGITRSAPSIRHRIDAEGARFSFSQPGSAVGTVRADTLEWTTFFGKLTDRPDSLASSFALSGVTWAPPIPFREKYSFFIQGFGYPADAIPLDRVEARYRYHPARDSLAVEQMTLYSDLFDTSIQGSITLDEELFGRSRVNDIRVELQELSPRFQNFIGQLKQLTGLPLAEDEDKITLSIGGSVGEPSITFGN